VKGGTIVKPILLATDGSPAAERATDTAIELAKLLGAELVVTTVWSIPALTVGFAPAPLPADIGTPAEDQARRIAAEAASRAEKAGVETRLAVLRGFPAEEICLVADRYDPRFLVIGSHGWGAFKRAVFGSVSTSVLHHAHCPVLVVPGVKVEAGAAANGTREHAHA
jgi:nucleotide-binding universal stress UspA family protein